MVVLPQKTNGRPAGMAVNFRRGIMGLFIHGLRNSVFLSAGLASASLMCASIDSARAQTGGPANSLNAGAGNGAADGSALEEVVVTARKREERLIDVPVAVTGISAETLSQVPTTSL